MRHLRLVTFIVFAVCALSLPTMARGSSDSEPDKPPIQKTNTSQLAVLATSLNGKITLKDAGLTVLPLGVGAIPVNVGISAKTIFTLNGVAASFAGINVGDSVVVKYLPLSSQAVDAVSVEAHRHRRGTVSAILEPVPPPANYPFCPYVGSGGTITNEMTPCYCSGCGGAESGMIW